MRVTSGSRVLLIAPLVLCVVLGGAERALPKDDAAGFRPTRAERLLPSSTIAFLSVPDYPAMVKKWSQAGFRPVWSNPALRTLFKQFDPLLPKDWRGQREDRRREQSFAWQELLALPAGEACLALAQTEAGKSAPIIVLGCRGHEKALTGFFNRLGAQGSKDRKPAKLAVAGVEIVRYGSLSYFVKDGLLTATSDPRLAEQLARAPDAQQGVIKGEHWHAVREQAEMNKEAADPDIRWFVRPREFVDAFPRAKGSPIVADIGLDLVRCAGGGCWFGHGEQAALYRIGVFVPQAGEHGRSPLLLPRVESHDPPEWVPATVASYASFRCDLRRSIPALGDIFDCVVGEGEQGVFRDFLTGIKSDPNGPQVDLDAEIYQKLRSRVIMLWGPERPDTSAWANFGFGLEVSDEAVVAKAIARLYKDPSGKSRRVDGATFFYSEDKGREEAEEVPEIEAPTRGKVSPERRPERVAFAGVAHKCLIEGIGKELFASLSAPKRPLAVDKDYRRVAETLNRLAGGPVSGRSFSRVGDDLRLVEQCVTPVTIIAPLGGGAAFDRQNSSETTGNARPTKPATADKAKPAEARSACGPGGWVASPTPKGCRVVGCVLGPAVRADKP